MLERTQGSLRLGFVARDGETQAHETYQAGALRVRFSAANEAILINTAGGLTGGDRCDVAISAGVGARAVITTQACERIYKSAADDTHLSTAIAVASGARLDYLPQPTILFEAARLRRTTTVEVRGDGLVLALEAGILGRAAMGETFTSGRVRDAWQVRRDGALVFADTLRLDGAPSTAPWAFGDAAAYATLIYVGPDAEARLEALRPLLPQKNAGASSWNGLTIARMLAADGYTLSRTLMHVLERFRACPLPRSWSL